MVAGSVKRRGNKEINFNDCSNGNAADSGCSNGLTGFVPGPIDVLDDDQGAPFLTLSSRTKSPDFSADGRADILWRNSSTGANNVWLMWSHCIKQVGSIAALGTNWNLIGNGDYDGDGGNLLWFMNGAGLGSVANTTTVSTSSGWTIR